MSNGVFAFLELRVFVRWVLGGTVRVEKSWDFSGAEKDDDLFPCRQASPSVACFDAVLNGYRESC